MRKLRQFCSMLLRALCETRDSKRRHDVAPVSPQPLLSTVLIGVGFGGTLGIARRISGGRNAARASPALGCRTQSAQPPLRCLCHRKCCGRGPARNAWCAPFSCNGGGLLAATRESARSGESGGGFHIYAADDQATRSCCIAALLNHAAHIAVRSPRSSIRSRLRCALAITASGDQRPARAPPRHRRNGLRVQLHEHRQSSPDRAGGWRPLLCHAPHSGSAVLLSCCLLLMRVQGCHCGHQRTTVTPIARAVPMMELQIDCSEMNSEPGSVCFTCRDEKLA
jgi:hypothetical protein